MENIGTKLCDMYSLMISMRPLFYYELFQTEQKTWNIMGGGSQPLNCCQLKITSKLFSFLIYKTLRVLMFNYLGEGKIAEKRMILSGIFGCPFPNLQFQLPTLPSFVQSSTPLN